MLFRSVTKQEATESGSVYDCLYNKENVTDSLTVAMESTRLVTGYINAYFEEKNYAEAEAVILWGIGLLQGLRLEDKNSIFDKVAAICYVCLGEARLRLGNEGGARQALILAKELGLWRGRALFPHCLYPSGCFCGGFPCPFPLPQGKYSSRRCFGI